MFSNLGSAILFYIFLIIPNWCRLSRVNRHPLLKRRYVIAFLAFLASVVSHSQRLNLSFALVDMVNATKGHSNGMNTTECPDLRNLTDPKENKNAEFSWNTELQGLILSSQYIGYCISQLPGGLVAERLGAKNMFLTNLIVGSLCNLVSPIAARTDPYLLFAVHFVKGMGQGLPLVGMSLLSARWFPKPEKGFLSAFIWSGYATGSFLGSLISGPLCALEFDGGWPLAFYVFGVFGFLVSIIIVIVFVENPTDDPNISKEELNYILENTNAKNLTKRSPTPWWSIMTSISTYSLIIAMFGQNWIVFYLMSVHPIYMDTILNIPIKENGLFNSGPYLAQALVGLTASLFSFWITKNDASKINVSRKGCNSLAVLLYVLGLSGIYLSGCDITWNVVFLFMAIATPAFAFGGCLIVSVDMTPTYCGPLMGLTSAISSLSGFIIPILTGKLTKDKQTMAQWHILFLITIIIAIVDGVVFLFWGSTEIQPYDPAYKKEQDKLPQQETHASEFISTHL